MLYAINRGIVPGYTRGQRSVIYLVSTAQAVAAAKLAWVFTDGHGIMQMTECFDDLACLDRIDWGIMRERYWADTLEDGDRKRRRQAEFLVHRFFPWGLAQAIRVLDDAMKDAVEKALENAPRQPNVKVESRWYYD
jgi:hypothetical protein